MFSLLPEEYRKKLKTEYRLRLAVIAIFGIFLLAIISGIFIFPTYLRVTTENAISLEQKLALEKQIAMQTGLKSADDIKSIKQNLSIATLDQRSFISAVNSVVQVQSADIKLTNFSYSYNVGTSTMIISGTALNRLSLQLFQKNLANQKLFNSADLPLSDYAKDTNIPFSITLVGAF